jgi:hypothetical protein
MSRAANPQYPRHAEAQIRAALKDTPVVLVNGPRQAGKTTLARQFEGGKRIYHTLDDATVLQGALADPAGFVRDMDSAIIDEIQRAPALLPAIKKSVDEDRRPGRFLLTGSANLLTLPTVSESLAGRMAIITLLPLSPAEVDGRRPDFIERLFAGRFAGPEHLRVGRDLVELVLAGGYPEMLKRTDSRRRQAWARDYLRAIVSRDVREIAEVEKLDQIPRLLRALGLHAAQLANFSQLGGRAGMDDKTTRKYVALLEQLFLVRRLEPWSRSRMKRLIKTPKLHLFDSGLLAALTSTTAAVIAGDRGRFGPLLESFVFSELEKQIAWRDEPCALYFYRDRDRFEVDFVLESDSGQIAGVEVKAAASVGQDDFNGLKKLAAASGKAFSAGVVLYDGETIVPFGDQLYAVPLSCFW